MHDPSSLERMAIRRVREGFGALVDTVASGRRIVVCRRSTPLAVLLPQETTRNSSSSTSAISRSQRFSEGAEFSSTRGTQRTSSRL